MKQELEINGISLDTEEIVKKCEDKQCTEEIINPFSSFFEIMPEVTSIGGWAFYNRSDLTTVTIPEGVTSIEEFAFAGCSNLASIVIPEGVTSIGRSAFACCTRLTTINIPKSVTSIGNGAFEHCKCLATITIPESVTNISNFAFDGCEWLKDVYCYSEEVPKAGNETFAYLELSALTLHVPNESIEKYRITEPWCRFGKIIPIE